MDKVPIPSRAKARAQRKKLHIQHSFSLNNLLSDPFALSTISICLLSWCIAIAGCVATASDSNNFPRFTWWGIAYQFTILIMLITFYCYDVVDYYKGFITGATAVSFVYNSNSATILVYGDGSRKAAASAGVILLSIVNLIWIFYYGSDNASPTSRWIDSFSLRGIRPSATQDAFMRARRRTRAHLRSQRFTGENFYPDQQPQNYMSSTALTGFENPDPAYYSGTNPQADGQAEGHLSVAYSDNNLPGSLNQSNLMVNNQGTFNQSTFLTETSNGNTDTTMGGTLELYSDTGEENFPYTAQTLYRYQADAEDAYEISFEQGEILKVSDIEGRWWKAKRSNGETGIIPSNYVQLIDDNVL